MDFTTAEITGWVGRYGWLFMRLSGLMISAPFFSHRLIPVRIKIALTLALTIMMAPMVDTVPQVEPLSVMGLIISVNQVIIGIAMGFLIGLGFSVIVMAGENISFKMGLGFATMADPQNGTSVPILSQFLLILCTLMFLSIGGHVILLEILVTSFKSLPIGVTGFSTEGMWKIITWGSAMFAASIILSLPVVVILTLVNLALGVMTRAAPTLNIFSVGFPISLLLGLVMVLYVLLPALSNQMTAIWLELFSYLRHILGIA
ncbi:MAG: flagellar biosynthetic protein FliR [Gammaproteobacteria bacterium]|nr:MAG: flagellar biosynthetic protein FliR [Gammaproteobacteria bacterium]